MKISKIEIYRPISSNSDWERLEIIETNLFRLINSVNEIIEVINYKETLKKKANDKKL